MKVPAFLDIRGSFGAKVLAAMLGTVGLLLLATLVAVRVETARQVGLVQERVHVQSREVFNQLEALTRQQLARLGSAFVSSVRARVLVDEAIRDRDLDYISGQANYQLELLQAPSSLAVFTDADAQPVLTIVDGQTTDDPDPANVGPLAAQLLGEGAQELLAYRRLGNRLFTVQVFYLELARRPIGTVTFGIPLTDEDAARFGRSVGGEVCFVVDGQCLAGTERARGALSSALVGMARERTDAVVNYGGERWVVISEDLVPDRPGDGVRVMAAALGPVLAPFDRISRALLLSGIGALLVALFVSLFLARGLTRPVLELEEATGRVAQGDYEAHVEPRSHDELGRLAASFNEMTHGLLLKEQYRGVLDKVVSRDVAEELLKGDVVLGGENRQVTVLFADLEGFTTLTDGMEPQRVIGLLNECMERLGTAVEEAGGVVDKYVGDEVMAIFGAPVAAPDDAVRGVRAAVRMQQAMQALNDERQARGEEPVHLNIGINTGVAVAGNMGSPSRLNYTVLGDTVNLAARICQTAHSGQTLISANTFERVRQVVRAGSLGGHRFKGFSNEVELYQVEGMREMEARQRAGTGGNHGGVMALILTMGMLLAGTGGASAQRGRGGLPTLRDLGLSYISPAGTFQVDLSGRLDLEGYLPQQEPAWIIPDTDPFVAGRARVFMDIFAGDHIYGLVELRADRGEEPRAGPVDARIDQAFVRLSVSQHVPVQLQVGKFASPFAGYPQRHHTPSDPFIRPPVMYDYRTMICAPIAPVDPDAFVSWKDDPADVFRPKGAPPIWGAPYQWGAMVLGGSGSLSYRLGLMNSAPSSEPRDWEWDADRFRKGPSIVANVGYQLSPGLRLEGSYDRGAYLEPDFSGTLDPGRSWFDYIQEIWGAEAIYRRGRATLRGEAFFDRWVVPNTVNDAWDYSYYLEGQMTVAPGAFLAARFGQIYFGRIPAADGTGTSPYGYAINGNHWDYDISRLQLGGGYRLLPNVEARAEYMISYTRRPGGDPPDNLASVQLWWQY